MTKFEFLGDLSRLIADLPQEEVEQAMEYYEDYFADAGPEKEQEIIKDFISPAYIAEQLREASLQRQKVAAESSMRDEERRANAAAAAAAAEKPTVFSRKLAAQAQKNVAMQAGSATVQPTQTPQTSAVPQGQSVMAQPAQASSPQSGAVPAAQAPHAQSGTAQTMQTAPAQAAMAQPVQTSPVQPSATQAVQTQSTTAQTVQAAQTQPVQSSQPSAGTGSAISSTQPEKKSNSMRNSIFRDDSDEDKEKAEKELALKNKTKIDIKSINATTSKVDKKQARANAKRNAAEEKAYNAERYSSSKKMVIGIVLLITCPVWLALLGAIVGLFVIGAGAVVGCIVGGIAFVIASIASLLLALLALLTMKIPTCIFSLGLVFFLFAAGIGLCFLGYKLVTRIIPSGYFNVQVLFSSVKAKISRLALK